MKIETKHNIGQIVYLVTDNEQTERMITGIRITGNLDVKYCLSLGTSMETWHYAIEFTNEIDNLKKILNYSNDN